MNWYAIYTKSRKEDDVAARLDDCGIEILNPKIKSKKYRRNKFTDVIEPLFACYLFAHFDRDKYYRTIKYTRGVRYILGNGSPVVVPDAIVNAIKERMEEGDVAVIRPQRLEKGDRVKVREGPFKDFYAIFERETKGPERVLILLDAINFRLEIDSSFLAKV